jgi:acid phosphatase (class A)
MRRIRTLPLLIVLLLFAGAAAAQPYLTAKQLDLLHYLPPPVANGSEADRAAQAVVIAAQKAASPERIALAAADAEESVFAMFTRTLGADFVPANLPKSAAFFARVGDSEDETVDPVKKFYGRTRPFLANPEIKALVKPSKSGAYPSGHTSRVTLMATVLSTMAPELRAVLWTRAAEYAESRVIGGMHYPQDLDGGERAGAAMAATMFADPTFRADFEVARIEVRRVLKLP